MPKTFEPPHSMTVTADGLPHVSISNKARSTFFAPGQFGKEVDFNQTDASYYEDFSQRVSREFLCQEGDVYSSSHIGPQGPLVSIWRAPDSVSLSPPWQWWRLRRLSAQPVSTTNETSLPHPRRVILPGTNQEDFSIGANSDATGGIVDVERAALLSNDETPHSSLASDSEDWEPHLEQRWFHQNLQFILHDLLEGWQGFRTQTHSHIHRQSNTPGEDYLPPDGQSSGDSHKRQRDPEADGLGSTSGSSTIAKRRKGTAEDNTEPPLACPFSKKDLHVYRECTKFGFKRARDVKQHLKRNHTPEVAEPTRLRLQKPSSRGTREHQWYEVFDILFPGHLSRPCSPYNDFEICQQPPAVAAAVDEALHIPYHYLMTEGAGILLQEIQQDPAFSREGGPGINDMRRALGRLFGQYLNQQLERPLGTPNGNNGTPEESLSSNPDTGQEGLSLGGERTTTLVSESPDYTLRNQLGMPRYSSHQNRLIGDDQAAENFTQHDNGNLVSVNQAFEVVGQDMDTVAASNHEELLPCEFEELVRGIYPDFSFDDDPSYS
ncbi:uncharacterized protein FTOL_07234 [Fusarium torulosum]|uniref:Uncharacterized protein n=1 Tax=Fusarium torulosum TaxID=33205 RepID=A0AAE8MBB8_9HYPO|nr:uncharacterized protein FTOL_07234 [Fusarium torulosum]